MRVAILLVALTACGRLGFGEQDPSDGGGNFDGAPEDGENPIALPQFCDDRLVTTLPIGPLDAVAIRAVALDTGYAVAIETAAFDIPLVEVDATGAFVATHAPFTPDYAPLYGISKHDDRPVVHMKTSGFSYLKFVEPGWEAYATGPSGDGAMIDPAYAQLDESRGFGARMNGGDFEVGIIDVDVDPAVIEATSYTPRPAMSGSLVPIPSGARVVVEKDAGVCETFTLSSTNVAGPIHTFSPCYEPKLAALDSTSGAIVHRVAAGGPFAVHLIPAVAADTGTTLPLTGATHARVAARIDGAYWVGHGSGSYRALVRITPAGVATEHRENTGAFYFDLTERDAFWYEGNTLHVSTPCLR